MTSKKGKKAAKKQMAAQVKAQIHAHVNEPRDIDLEARDNEILNAADSLRMFGPRMGRIARKVYFEGSVLFVEANFDTITEDDKIALIGVFDLVNAI